MKKMALLFPGQGSQYIGMAKRLCSDFEDANRIFDEANDVLNFDLKKLCFEGDIEELTNTYNAQPAILTASTAAFKVYMQEIGIEPNYLAGHSLGEFSALVCGEVLNFSDALKLVRYRGKLMSEAGEHEKGAMAAVGNMDVEQVEEVCKEVSSDKNSVAIACYNSSDQLVISGHKDAIEKAINKIQIMGGKVTPLKVSMAFHSPLLIPQANKLGEELCKYTFKQNKYPIISNVTGEPYKDKEDMIKNLKLQMYKPVQWINSMKYLERNNIVLAVEIGPGTTLKRLAAKNIKHISAFSYDRLQEVNDVTKLILPINNGSEYSLVQKCISAAITTPNNNFNVDDYRIGVIEPYKKIQELQFELEQAALAPNVEQMKAALSMLKCIFTTKNITLEEQKEKFKQILDETNTNNLFGEWIFEI